MAYEPLNLQNGQVLTAEDLQHMEQGIMNADGGVPKGNSVATFFDTGVEFEYTRQEGTDAVDTEKYPVAFTEDSGEGPYFFMSLYTGEDVSQYYGIHFVVRVADSVWATGAPAGADEVGLYYTNPAIGTGEMVGSLRIVYESTEHTNYDGSTTTIQPGIYLCSETGSDTPRFWGPSFACHVYTIGNIEPPYLGEKVVQCWNNEENNRVIRSWYGGWDTSSLSDIPFENGVRIASSTPGSSKMFVLTVNDNGTVSATEI